MFICRECGCEYKIKPDFCDCGNDTFEEIPEKAGAHKVSVSLSKSELMSWLIFWILILCSVLVLLYFPKIETQPNQHPKNIVSEKPAQKIPNINNFWKDSIPALPQETVFVEPVAEVINIIKPKAELKKTVKPPQVKKTQPVSKPQNVVKQQPKTVSKPVQTVKKVETQPKPAPARSLDYEMLNYRSSLRMRLLSNLPTSEIQGSGKCGIEFSIDETGKLINRGFTFQSDNSTVNDAVYKMLMRTPRFNPPPDSYDGRKIKMVFNLSSGSYEISFTN